MDKVCGGLLDYKSTQDKFCEGCKHIHYMPDAPEQTVCVGCSKQYKAGKETKFDL